MIFCFWMENYKKVVSPFPVIKTKQSKHYFNLCCTSGSHFLHHFTGLSPALPNVGCLYFFFSYICFSSNSLKFLHFLYNFHFPSVTFSPAPLFLWTYTGKLHLSFFFFNSLFSFSFFPHHFLKSYFLSCPGKSKSHANTKYNHSPTSLPWRGQALGSQSIY